ncbi:uncharacterized protein LOC143282541 [Babylonia areolata]|uniref:uncharacterized protein LOC143282541 n=1 Tax=Babylonia areolata TaxID=304850 RepID=UPI003FD15C1D
MSANNSSTEGTQEEVETFLIRLSDTSFKNRTPVVVYLSLISIVGLLGNTLVLLVYGFRFQPSANRVFILFIASLDLITNIFAIPIQIVTVSNAYKDNYWRCRSFFAFSTLSTQASNFVLVLVAVDRFWRICAPLRKQLNHRQAFHLAVGTVCSAVVIFVPFIPFYGMHSVNTTEPGIQFRMCWYEEEYKDTPYPMTYTVVVGITFLAGLATMIICYVSIGIHLWKEKQERQRSLKENQVQTVSTAAEPGTTVANASNECVSQETPGNQKHVLMTGSLSGQDFHSELMKELHHRFVIFDPVNTFNLLSIPSLPDSETLLDTYTTDKYTLTQGEESKNDALEDKLGRPRSEEAAPGEGTSNPPDGQKQASTQQKREGGRRYIVSVNTGVRRMRHRTTFMMSVLTLFYIINWLPHLVVRTFFDDPTIHCENFPNCSSNIYDITIWSIYLNSAVNAFVYSMCNGRFRQKCKEFFRDIVTKKTTTLP